MAKVARVATGCGTNLPANTPFNEYSMRLGDTPTLMCTVRVLRRGETFQPRRKTCPARKVRRG